MSRWLEESLWNIMPRLFKGHERVCNITDESGSILSTRAWVNKFGRWG